MDRAQNRYNALRMLRIPAASIARSHPDLRRYAEAEMQGPPAAPSTGIEHSMEMGDSGMELTRDGWRPKRPAAPAASIVPQVHPSGFLTMQPPAGSPVRDRGASAPWEIEPPTIDYGRLPIGEIIREAESAGEIPVDFYRTRVPKNKIDTQMVSALAFTNPTPSNGESREQAAAREARMRGGYAGGMPVPQGPQADAIRARFRNPTGPANPQTAADLAGLDAQAGKYAQTIRGSGGSYGDFNTYAPEPGNPEDRRMLAQRQALMPASERALLASAPPRGPAPGGGGPSPTLMAALGAPGPAGPAGTPSAMTPEAAMARLVERRGGFHFPGEGYVTQRGLGELDTAIAGGAHGGQVLTGMQRRQGEKVSGISPEYRKELDSRKAAVKERGLTRRQIPGDILSDHMSLNWLEKNPGVMEALLGAQGQQAQITAMRELKQMELDQSKAEGEATRGIQQDALKLQQLQALITEGGVPYEEAWARVYSGGEGGAAVAPPAGGVPSTPRSIGLEFSARDDTNIAAFSSGENARADIAAYGRAQTPPWSQEKIDRAIRKYTGSDYATEAGSGWGNWLFSGSGKPTPPGQAMEYGIGNVFFGQPDIARSSDRRR